MAKEPEKVERGSLSAEKLEQLLQDYDQLIHSQPAETQPEGEPAQTLSPKVAQQLLSLAREAGAAARQIDSAQVYQTFKLPGTQTWVHDRRGKTEEKPEQGKTLEAESKMSLTELLVRKGRLTPAKEKEYENFLADPSSRMKVPEQKAAEDRLKKMLTRFEELIIKRFEEDAGVAKFAKEGQSSFLKKTYEQWRQFFDHFRHRTVKRQIDAEQLQGAIFRDWVAGKGKATLISDLILGSGQLEKYIRIRLQTMTEMWRTRFSQLQPGTRLGKEVFAEIAGEKELQYLAIREAERQASWSQAPAKGILGGLAKTEEQVAQELGIPIKKQMRRRGKGLGKDETPDEIQETFVPGWSSRREKRQGPVRWFVPVVYATTAAVVAVFIWWLLR